MSPYLSYGEETNLLQQLFPQISIYEESIPESYEDSADDLHICEYIIINMYLIPLK